MPNLAMRQPGTQFSGDGLSLSWPLGGEREVVAVPDDMMSLRIRRRVAEGQISIVDDAPTQKADADAREYRLLTGEEARAHFDEPAGPVTRIVYHPADQDPDNYQREVKEVQGISDRNIEATEEAFKAAEENSQAIAERQAKAEKAAAEKAAAAEAEEDVEDPIAQRLNQQTTEAAEDYAAKQEAEFMEREKARQKLEGEYTYEPEAAEEPDTSKEEAKAAAAEEARQKEEDDTKDEREAEAKAAQAAEKKSAEDQKALSEPTPVKAPAKGTTPESKGGQPTGSSKKS